MGLLTRVAGAIDTITSDSDDGFNTYIDKKYLYLTSVFAIYSRYNKRFWPLSVFQVVFYEVVLFYHWIILVNSTIVIAKINMILYCQSAHFTLLVQLTLILLVFFQQKRMIIKKIHLMMVSGFYDYQEPPLTGVDTVRASLNDEQRMLTLIPIGVGLAGCLILILGPVVDNNFGTFDFSTTSKLFNDDLPYGYAQYPYATTNSWYGYYFTFLGQGACVLLTAGIIASGGYLFINVAQHMTFELKILHLSIENVELRAKQQFSKLFRKTNKNGRVLYDDKYYSFCYSQCLKRNFEHHQIIMSMFKLLVELASVPVFLAYMTGTIVIALSLISTGSAKELPGTTVSAMVLCGVEVGYMFIFSVFGQRFNDLSQDLRFRIYCIKWYYCTDEVKRSLRIFQSITIRPLSLMAGGIVPANMETFGTVMNSAYSYYNLVNAFGVN